MMIWKKISLLVLFCLLIANNISGSGNITAKGGDGYNLAGGGGRIALHASIINFNGIMSMDTGRTGILPVR